jgi:hypothetical protein
VHARIGLRLALLRESRFDLSHQRPDQLHRIVPIVFTSANEVMWHHRAHRRPPHQPCGEERTLTHARPARHHDPAIRAVFYQQLIEPIQQRGTPDEPSVPLELRREVDDPRRSRRWRQGYRESAGQDQLAGIHVGADLELRANTAVLTFQIDRGAALLVGRCDRLTLGQATVETGREASRCDIAGCAAHSDDTLDVREQRVGLGVAVAGIENNHLDRGAHRAEGLRKRCRRNDPGITTWTLEAHLVPAAVPAEVNHHRFQSA